MRIIAGEYRGRVLKAPKGDATRPTTDRVREALMSSLGSARGGFEGAVVLDAFAGSGALGLEALSRGANQVIFYEKDTAALRVLRANIASLGIEPQQVVVRNTDIMKHPPQAFDISYDLVFFDPPYMVDPKDIALLLCALDDTGILASDVLVSYEHAKSSDSAVAAAFDLLQWEIVSHKNYGDIAVDILQRSR